MDYNRAYSNDIKNLLTCSSYSLSGVMQALIGLNIYDAWKNRSDLTQAIALDKEILSKLQEIKDSLDGFEPADNSVSAENFLLENAAEGSLIE